MFQCKHYNNPTTLLGLDNGWILQLDSKSINMVMLINDLLVY